MHTWSDGGKYEDTDQDSTKACAGCREGEGFKPMKWEIEGGK